MNLSKNITVIGFIAILGRFWGYIRDAVLVSFLGVGALADALFLSAKIASLFRRLFTEGGFNASFIPIFNDVKVHHGLKEATRFTEQAITWMTLITGAVVVCILLKANAFVRFMAPGFIPGSEKFLWTVELTRIVFPYVMILCITALLGGFLNALYHFYHTAACISVGNIVIVVFIYVFKDMFSTVAHGAGYAILVSAIFQFVWLYIVAWKKDNICLRFVVPSWNKDIKQFFVRILPGIFGTGMSQINVLLSIFFGSYLTDGGVVYLQITERMKQFPLSVIGVAIGTVLIPMLSEKLQKGDISSAMKIQNESITIALRIAIPTSLFFIFFSPISIATLFLYGEFSIGDVYAVSPCLQVMILGLPAYVLVKVFSSTFFALKDTLRPAIAGLLSMVVNTVLSIWVIKNNLGLFLSGAVGLSASLAISGWVNLLILAGWLGIKKYFSLGIDWKKTFVIETGTFVLFALSLFILYSMFDFSSFENAFVFRIKCLVLTIGSILLYWCINRMLKRLLS
jgi:putative peptidoglycan lipid II flippase